MTFTELRLELIPRMKYSIFPKYIKYFSQKRQFKDGFYHNIDEPTIEVIFDANSILEWLNFFALSNFTKEQLQYIFNILDIEFEKYKVKEYSELTMFIKKDEENDILRIKNLIIQNYTILRHKVLKQKNKVGRVMQAHKLFAYVFLLKPPSYKEYAERHDLKCDSVKAYNNKYLNKKTAESSIKTIIELQEDIRNFLIENEYYDALDIFNKQPYLTSLIRN